MGDKIFLSLDGITGDSTDSNHIGWIPIHSIHFEALRKVEFEIHVGNQAPNTSIPALSKITLTKPSCVASPDIFTHLNTFKWTRLIIDVVHEKVNGNTAESFAGSGYTRYESEQCWVSNFELNGIEGVGLIEKITLAVPMLIITHNPPISSTDKRSSSGYNYQMAKTI